MLELNLTKICNDLDGRMLVQVDLNFDGEFSPDKIQESARESIKECFKERIEQVELEPYIDVNGGKAFVKAYVTLKEVFHNLLNGVRITTTSVDSVERISFKVEQEAPEHYNLEVITNLFDREMRKNYGNRVLSSELKNVRNVPTQGGRLISFDYFVYLKI